MKALGWYTVIFNILVIIAFILNTTGVIDAPPFTTFENVAWIVLTLPVVILGWLVVKRSE